MATLRKIVKTIPTTIVTYKVGGESRKYETADSRQKAIATVKSFVGDATDISAFVVDRTYEMTPETFLMYATPVPREDGAPR